MGLNYIEVSAEKASCVTVSGVCDVGTHNPALPGDLSWKLLSALASPSQMVAVEVPAPIIEQSYYLDSSLPSCPLQRGWLDRIGGRGIILGVLREETAPSWFEQPGILRGYLIDEFGIERLADFLVNRPNRNSLLNIVPLFFDLYTAKNLVFYSRQIADTDIAATAVETAEAMNLPVRWDETSRPAKRQRRSLLLR